MEEERDYYTDEELAQLREIEEAMERCHNDCNYNEIDYERDVCEFYNNNKEYYDKLKPIRENYDDVIDYRDALEDWEQNVADDYEKSLK